VGAAQPSTWRWFIFNDINHRWYMNGGLWLLSCYVCWSGRRWVHPPSIFLVGGTRGKHQINQETLFIGVDISLKRRTKRCRASSAKKYQKNHRDRNGPSKTRVPRFFQIFSPRIQQQKYGALHLKKEVAGSVTDTRYLGKLNNDLTAILE
jgi:hypothetical protein